MDQVKIGRFIAEKRKEQGLTQAQLAEALVPDKTKALVWRKGLFSMNPAAKKLIRYSRF